MSYIAIALFLMQEYKFLSVALLCGIGIGIGIVVCFFLLKQSLRKILIWSVFLFALLFLSNMLFGFTLRNWGIAISGTQGEGVITRVSATSSLYNRRPIMQFDVTLRCKHGELLQARFYSDAFNVVQGENWNSTNYPLAGEKFNTICIPAYPRAFVILTDTESEYGQRMQKTAQFAARANAEQMHATNIALQGQTTIARLQEYKVLQERLKSSPEDAAVLARIEALAEQEEAIQSLWQLAKTKSTQAKSAE
jgi:hypothetical protein